MVLEAELAGAGKVLEGFLEFVHGAVGVLVAGGPVFNVGFEDVLAVEDDLDDP